jgi:hypothetical protein
VLENATRRNGFASYFPSQKALFDTEDGQMAEKAHAETR